MRDFYILRFTEPQMEFVRWKCNYLSKGKNATGMRALAKSISLNKTKFICIQNYKHTIQIVTQMIVFV